MKLHFTAIAMLFILMGSRVLSRTSELYTSKYYVFQSNPQLNAHLFLYSKAINCRLAGVNNDSLAYHAFGDQYKQLSAKEHTVLNSIVRFYKDSLIGKDLLFDSLMRGVSDYLSAGSPSKTKLKTPWQHATLENLRIFQPYFTKLYWPAIDSTNRAWLIANKSQVTAMETEVVPELEKIYKTSLPEGRIRVDLTCYATWAGAYSFNDTFCHIVFSSAYKANQGDLAAEVIFHETSHFLVEKLMMQVSAIARSRQVEKDLGLWHDVIFYTTGFVLEKQYKLKWQKFEPYYVQMKFQEKFPPFSKSVEGCKRHWDPYLNGQVSFETALNNLVDYVIIK